MGYPDNYIDSLAPDRALTRQEEREWEIAELKEVMERFIAARALQYAKQFAEDLKSFGRGYSDFHKKYLRDGETEEQALVASLKEVLTDAADIPDPEREAEPHCPIEDGYEQT